MLSESRVIVMEPAYRASLIQAQKRAMLVLPRGLGERVAERVGAEALTVIDEAGATDWLPVELTNKLGQALYEEAGAEGSIEFWRRFAGTLSSMSLFDAMVKGVLKLVGTPEGLLQLIPRAYALTSRGLGSFDLTVDPDENRATLSVTGLPKVSQTKSVIISIQASCLGVLDMVSVDGEVGVDDFRVDEGPVNYIVLWRN